MGLPHQRETMEAAKARVATALEPLWNAAKMNRQCRKDPQADTPGKHRRHVFDFADGLRLIVSRDELPQPLEETGIAIVIHVSCSVDMESTLCGTLPNDDTGQKTLARIASQRISELLDADCPPEPAFWWADSVAHWFLTTD
jgi:hypothetical protein